MILLEAAPHPHSTELARKSAALLPEGGGHNFRQKAKTHHNVISKSSKLGRTWAGKTQNSSSLRLWPWLGQATDQSEI